jgi:hypothetical protein
MDGLLNLLLAFNLFFSNVSSDHRPSGKTAGSAGKKIISSKNSCYDPFTIKK